MVNVLSASLFTARIEEMKQGLLNKISVLGKELPLNTLDELIDKFGGPDKVSEVRALDTKLETLRPRVSNKLKSMFTQKYK